MEHRVLTCCQRAKERALARAGSVFSADSYAGCQAEVVTARDAASPNIPEAQLLQLQVLSWKVRTRQRRTNQMLSATTWSQLAGKTEEDCHKGQIYREVSGSSFSTCLPSEPSEDGQTVWDPDFEDQKVFASIRRPSTACCPEQQHLHEETPQLSHTMLSPSAQLSWCKISL
eukprot:TRINITY_DN15127_c0_g1_i1.p1 TRINITY_DN15127_c0_g1~~TRINITY_DN15127_c0_g1_i1.p1  ORF type:complete len:172 (-),score=6.36 TRINITY_DN15127_c0_g1_i1:657-1172(-)